MVGTNLSIRAPGAPKRSPSQGDARLKLAHSVGFECRNFALRFEIQEYRVDFFFVSLSMLMNFAVHFGT